ncbi:helix-turn-helix domain-containing protein [Candidatus Methylomirabilis sp.]|uniref:helix-turn-helix domain-containing protein n=1 Tax=Candidatus Methylomirabilis sp. TaxID=2032687 RepID=UPI002A5F37A6|nr:helix-turn-helix domain-containing protein [Candidatus Methylomirabilis sp.]
MTVQEKKGSHDPRTIGFRALYEAAKILSDQVDLEQVLGELERELVMRALRENGGVQARAAARLGLTPRQFAYKMKKYRIIKEFRIDG